MPTALAMNAPRNDPMIPTMMFMNKPMSLPVSFSAIQPAIPPMRIVPSHPTPPPRSMSVLGSMIFFLCMSGYDARRQYDDDRSDGCRNDIANRLVLDAEGYSEIVQQE